MKCLRPGCDRPAKSNGNGRPAEYCSTACKQSVHRLFQRLLKRRGFTTLLDDVQRAVAAWEICHGLDLSADHVEHVEAFAAIMDAIAAHPLVGSRAAPPGPSFPPRNPCPARRPFLDRPGRVQLSQRFKIGLRTIEHEHQAHDVGLGTFKA